MTESTHEPEIVTEGTGWHEQLGDRAELDVGFTVTERTRTAAVAALGTRVAAVLPTLETVGLTVRHRRLSVHNEWRRDRVVGCRATEDISLVVTDVTVLDAVLSALVDVEPTDLRGPRWTLADPVAARREAQRRAVADARDRAEGYAAALGGTLGPLRRLSEAPDHGGPIGYRTAAYEGSGVPDVRHLALEPEPVRVTVRCSTAWTMHSV
ncbi:MAG: SIMPL domain-containing protein [Pseudonocardia sp.]|nr:SIMPL domain-containing protein [Pseudonocardia sp.]